MTAMRNNPFTDDPNFVNAVHERKGYVAFAMDRLAVPADNKTPSALLELVLDFYQLAGVPLEDQVRIFQGIAGMIQMRAAAKGKPS